jgi:hypothetical protein
MPQAQTLRIRGYREFLRAATRAEKESKKEVRAALRAVAEPVRVEAASLFDTLDARSAAGYRVRVRQRGVSVEQSLRKTTGKHPEFGSLQMREALIPALEAKEHEIERGMEDAIDRIADHFER